MASCAAIGPAFRSAALQRGSRRISRIRTSIGARAASVTSCSRRARRRIPGSDFSDRGLSPTGSLLVDDGVPNYDIADGLHRMRSFRPATSKQPSSTTRLTSQVSVRRSRRRRGRRPHAVRRPERTSKWSCWGTDAILRAAAGSDDAGNFRPGRNFTNDESRVNAAIVRRTCHPVRISRSALRPAPNRAAATQ